MKIKSITLKNHKILKSLSLDFTRSDGTIANTIILAGENGCGKSTILKLLFDFSRYSPLPQSQGEMIIVAKLSDNDLNILKKLFPAINNVKDNELTFSYDCSKGSWDQIEIGFNDNNGNTVNIAGVQIHKAQTLFKALFSDVEINFTPSAINGVTAKNIDAPVITSVKNQSNLATEITQLLIDIQALDDAEFTTWARNNQEKQIDISKLDSRISRFKDAFNYMFPHLQYKNVQNINNMKKVIFEGPSGEIPIEELSSGEKQIVFRGGFLLQDQQSNTGAIILLDEPEISLHPRWQKKITDFNKRLFTDSSGTQTSQIFIATHSPFIVHNENRHDDKVIILKKDDSGIITCEDSPSFYGWTQEKKINEAFKINLNFDSNKTIVFVEGKTDEDYLKKAMSILGKNDLPLDFKWIGTLNSSGNAEFTGKKALNHAKALFSANPQLSKQKIILLYDSDTNKPPENDALLYVRTMPIQEKNITYKIGIENLLSLPSSFDKDNFYKERKKTDHYGAVSTICELDKTKLCGHICNDISPEQQKEYFMVFESVFDELNAVVNS